MFPDVLRILFVFRKNRKTIFFWRLVTNAKIKVDAENYTVPHPKEYAFKKHCRWMNITVQEKKKTFCKYASR